MASALLKAGLDLVVCGYNPSLECGCSCCPTPTPANRFWRVLFDELVEHYRDPTPLLA